MATSVFLTVDTEFAWRHHAAGLDVDTIYDRSIEPAGVGNIISAKGALPVLGGITYA